MCWLHGAAGSGKSAISKTIAELCAEGHRLGASFFFLRGAGRRSRITHLIPTLAFHLAFSIPATRPYIESVLHTDHHIVHRSLERQFRKLIIEPIQSVIIPTLPMVIMIDALDECDDKDMIANFIGIVAGAVQNPQFPFQFIFTSRVEDHIQKRFSAPPALDVTYCLALQDFNAHGDILTFFQSRFSTIYQENRRLMKHIELPWPSYSILDELVRKTAGSFIFAFTLANFVNDGSDLPHRKLEAALQSHAGLDPLYTQVLHTAPRSPHFLRIFEAIMVVTEHVSVVELAYLFDIETGDVVHTLLGVQSILVVPEDDESPIRPFHTSLRDFLTTRARSNEFFINPPIRHILITFDCLAIMVIHSDDDFSENKGLNFACRSWSHHLLCAIQEEGGDNFLFSQYSTFMEKLIDFVSRAFDLWVNSIIAQYLVGYTLHTLDSVVLTLKVGCSFQLGCRQNLTNVSSDISSMPAKFATDDREDQSLC
jgi:NACHT domain